MGSLQQPPYRAEQPPTGGRCGLPTRGLAGSPICDLGCFEAVLRERSAAAYRRYRESTLNDWESYWRRRSAAAVGACQSISAKGGCRRYDPILGPVRSDAMMLESHPRNPGTHFQWRYEPVAKVPASVSRVDSGR